MHRGGNQSATRYSRKLVLVLLLCSAAASAQITVGENLNLSLDGGLGYGYNGSFGNELDTSGHNQGFSGNADLTGYYFNPNFISFQFRPYYDRNQANTETQSVSRGTGFGASANFFGGSHFPGSISFGRDFSTNSEFQFAGVPTVAVDSSSQTFAITWSALLPKWPTLTATYSVGSSTSELLGAESHNSSKNLNLNSSYELGGWNLHGTFNHNSGDFSVPAFLSAEVITGGGSGTSYGLSASHRLPWKGSFGVSWSHASFEGSSGTEWNSSYLTVSNSFTPWHRFTFFQNANYTTNLAAMLSESVLNGGTVATLLTDSDSHGFSYSAGGSFDAGHGLTMGARYTHRVQWLMGRRYEDSQYGANFNYSRSNRLFGMLYFGLGVMDTVSQQGNDGMGFNAMVGMNKRFHRWETSADFTYFQNVQTIGTLATTSSYMYGASVKRKISNELRVSTGFRGSHSGLVLNPGTGNQGESISTSISWRRYNLGGSYSQSSGAAVFTSTGEIIPTPIGSLFTDNFILFNGHAWTVNASTLLFRHLSVAGGYSRFQSGTLSALSTVMDKGSRYNVRTEYRLRKFSLIGGYNRSWQYVSTLSPEPRVVNSYYLSFLRWFNVF